MRIFVNNLDSYVGKAGTPVLRPIRKPPRRKQ